ncbi:MAG TPA: CAP domain-containing protein [Bacteroidales bacterium]|nr:CAP domain-containing protein [Bacteroidales bacterium]HNS45693.1 CAP domain-containing protein [Bacteroidales bacterium]
MHFLMILLGLLGDASGGTLPLPTPAEYRLYGMINEYRTELELPPVPLSFSLCIVARTHARDLAENLPYDERCNLHSWSANGPWSACCYEKDHEQAPCMWEKPSELTPYKGRGYEIAYWNDFWYENPDDIVVDALNAWKKSNGHLSVMINTDRWRELEWKAMGVSVYKGYVLVWFGEEEEQ